MNAHEITLLIEKAKLMVNKKLATLPGDPRLQWVSAELDALQGAIQRQWPLPEGLARNVSIGRFGVREFENDNEDLSQLLSEINYETDTASGLR